MKLFKFLLIFFALIFSLNSLYSFQANSSNYSLSTNFGVIQTNANSSNYSATINGVDKLNGVGQVCSESWAYTTWSVCSSGTQTRTAIDANSCGTTILRGSLSQSCSSGEVSSGGGAPPIFTGTSTPSSSKETSIEKKVLELKTITKNKFEILIDDKVFSNYSKTYNKSKKVKLKNKKTNKEVLEFDYNFKKNLDLSKLEIISDNLSKKNYVIVKGLVLSNQTKTIKLPIVDNTNTICIKDMDISSINSISKNCKGFSEYILTCDGKLDSNGYKCVNSNSIYTISGLKHSGVLEFSAVKTPISNLNSTTTAQPQISTKTTTNSSSNNLNSQSGSSNSSNSTYIILAFIIIIVLIVVFILIKRRNNSNYHNLKENEPTQPSVSNFDNLKYNMVKDYVLKYKDSYSKDQIYRALKDNGSSEEIINRVFNEIY